jgi:hypothetical protein
MGYLGYFYVENKAFEFRSNVQGGVQLAEKSRGNCRSVIMAWPTIFWLVSAWDYLTNTETVRENWRTFRFGCLAYVMQRRNNSHGNFLELSEYGGKGRRSFVIIPEGIEGKGWEDCRVQLQRLKMHHEKQRKMILPAGALVGKKEQSNGVPKAKTQVGITYAAAVVGEKVMVGETQVAGDGVSKLDLEGANYTAKITPGDHVKQRPEILTTQYQGGDTQILKDILLSLQKEVASCLYKLEMGWGNKGNGFQLDKDNLENELKNGPHKEDGPGCIRSGPVDKPKPTRTQPIFRYYRKTYARRRLPRRQLKWRPKPIGRMEGQATGEPSENSRSRSPGQGIGRDDSEQAAKRDAQASAEVTNAADVAIGGGEVAKISGHAGIDAKLAGTCGDESEQADKRNAQHSAEVTNAVDVTIGGGEVAKNSGHAGIDAELAGTCGAVSEIANKIIFQLSTGDVPEAETTIGEEGVITAGQAGSDTEMAGSEEGPTDADVGGTGTVGEITNTAEETGGYLELAVEDSIFAGEEDSRFVIVPFSQTVVEQPDSDIPGEVMDGMKRGIGAYAIYKGGSSSGSLVNVEGEQFIDVPLEVEPLEAHPDCPEGKVCEWVIERVKGMCHVWGMSCEGYEGELEKLFRKIESNRGKANSPAATPTKSTLRGNRELRGLQWNMNSEGKLGKEKGGKNQKQRARGGGCLVIK